MLDLTLFSDTSFSVGLLGQLIFFMSMAGFYLVLAVYLQFGLGLDPLTAGLVFVANGAGYLLTSSQVGRLAISGRRVIAVAAAVRAAGLLLLSVAVSVEETSASVLWLVPGLFLNGAGTGLIVSPLASVILARVRPEHAGAASGVLNTALQIGNAVGVAAVGLLFFGTLAGSGAFQAALLYLIGLSLVLTALTRFMPG